MMTNPFVITQAQWQALELRPIARDIAQGAWTNQGRFALPPNPGSLAQVNANPCGRRREQGRVIVLSSMRYASPP